MRVRSPRGGKRESRSFGEELEGELDPWTAGMVYPQIPQIVADLFWGLG